MKRFICILLAFLILSPSALLFTKAAGSTEYPFSVSSLINLSDTGKTPGANSSHGNHQTRTVHTTHGDYAAYITDSYAEKSTGKTIDKWSLFKIDTEGGTSEIIFTGEKYYDSSQVSLLVDKDENVWAVTATSTLSGGTTEGIDCRAYRLDGATGEIKSYSAIVAGGAQDGYGYATIYYDKANDRIIALLAGGDYKEGSSTGASFNWAIFNMSNRRWVRRVYSVKIPSRHCYMSGFVDELGGLMFVAQRDIKCTSLGYPEIGHSSGLTQEDRDYMYDNKIFRWSANYCWDELDLYYIPDLQKTEILTYSIVTADYSRVIGTQSERNTFEKRLTNFYPENQNNNGGDTLLTKTADGRSLLHVTYNSAYIQAAMYRPVAEESVWYHQVWDVTDPKNAIKLYNGPIMTENGIADGVARNGSYSFRLYEDEKGELYFISVFDPKTEQEFYKDGAVKYETQYDSLLSVYRVESKGEGYSYQKLPKTVTLPGGGYILNISSHRGGSLKDGTVNLLYKDNDGNGDYVFASLTLSDLEILLGDINGDGEVTAKDSNLMKQALSGSIEFKNGTREFSAADIDGDGAISAKDSNLLKQMIAGVM